MLSSCCSNTSRLSAPPFSLITMANTVPLSWLVFESTPVPNVSQARQPVSISEFYRIREHLALDSRTYAMRRAYVGAARTAVVGPGCSPPRGAWPGRLPHPIVACDGLDATSDQTG